MQVFDIAKTEIFTFHFGDNIEINILFNFTYLLFLMRFETFRERDLRRRSGSICDGQTAGSRGRDTHLLAKLQKWFKSIWKDNSINFIICTSTEKYHNPGHLAFRQLEKRPYCFLALLESFQLHHAQIIICNFNVLDKWGRRIKKGICGRLKRSGNCHFVNRAYIMSYAF